jgi:hypothetical protein
MHVKSAADNEILLMTPHMIVIKALLEWKACFRSRVVSAYSSSTWFWQFFSGLSQSYEGSTADVFRAILSSGIEFSCLLWMQDTSITTRSLRYYDIFRKNVERWLTKSPITTIERWQRHFFPALKFEQEERCHLYIDRYNRMAEDQI